MGRACDMEWSRRGTMAENVRHEKGRIMKRSGDGGGARAKGFSVVDGGVSVTKVKGLSENEVWARRVAQDLVLMIAGLSTCGPDLVPRAKVPVDREFIDLALEGLVENGLMAKDRPAGTFRLTDPGRINADFLLGAYHVLTSYMEKGPDAHAVPGWVGSSPTDYSGPIDAFKFRIDLDLGQLHPCWREIIVPSDIPFSVFHMMIQSAFLFVGYHQYDFSLRTRGERVRIGEGAPTAAYGASAPGESDRAVEASTLYLDEVFPKTKTATYSYDYGDGWECKIRFVESIGGYSGPWPLCTAGSGDAPPEDVGGIGGFERYLKAISDPGDEEHDFMVAWGASQLWEPFSREAVNRRMEIWPTDELIKMWDAAHADEW